MGIIVQCRTGDWKWLGVNMGISTVRTECTIRRIRPKQLQSGDRNYGTRCVGFYRNEMDIQIEKVNVLMWRLCYNSVDHPSLVQ